MEALQEMLTPSLELLKDFLAALILATVAMVLGLAARYLRQKWGIDLDLAQLHKQDLQDLRFDEIVQDSIVAAQEEYKGGKEPMVESTGGLQQYRGLKKGTAIRHAVAWAAQEGIERTTEAVGARVERLLKQVKANL